MPSLPSFFRQLDSKLLRFPSFTRILSRLTRRTRRSDSTPGGAVSVRSKRSGSRTPGLKAPVREGTQFGKMFRNGNREPAVWAECAGHAGNWHAERQQSYEFTAGERGYGRVGNPFTRLRWEDWKGGPTSKLLAQIVVTE